MAFDLLMDNLGKVVCARGTNYRSDQCALTIGPNPPGVKQFVRAGYSRLRRVPPPSLQIKSKAAGFAFSPQFPSLPGNAILLNGGMVVPSPKSYLRAPQRPPRLCVIFHGTPYLCGPITGSRIATPARPSRTSAAPP